METGFNQRIIVKNPATGKEIGSYEETPIERVENLYYNAKTAFTYWGQAPVKERIAYLRKLRIYMVNNLDEIVKVISESTGKLPIEALSADILPVLDSIKHIEKHAEHILKPKKIHTPILLLGKKSYVEFKPRGVVLIISPWNYPFQLAMVPLLSAIASGNTVILKPSEVTPMVGKLIEDLFYNSGFPENVVQVAHGGKDLGAAMVKGKPDYIFFTGSVQTGKIIQAEAAKNLIPTTLELGGKDPMIVFADAHIDRAIRGALWGAFTNSGQVCMSVERLYVERKIYKEFMLKLQEEALKLNSGTDDDDDIGSMTFNNQIDIVKNHVEDALAKGANIVTGKKPENWNISNGLFIEPIIVTDVKQDMKIVQEETFGPILPIIPFDYEEEAIQLANDSSYGLNASVWTKDLDRAKKVASKLISGNVVINDVIVSIANPYLPFGGAKNSGIGLYHGDIGLQTFCQLTSVLIDSGKKKSEVNWYPYKGKFEHFKNLMNYYFGKQVNWPGFFNAYINLLKKSK